MSEAQSQPSVFDTRIPLPDETISKRAKTLIGFDERYKRVRDQLNLLHHLANLPNWSKEHYGKAVPLCDLISEQYPLVIFYGDVGTGKSATAEGIANRLISEAGSASEESLLFKLSNRVRGTGKVGEMGSLITEAFREVVKSAGRHRRGILIVDEGDSLGAKRDQEQSHHEDKVAVNTLIQHLDEIRQHRGRIIVFLCTNRLNVLDPALVRRAAIMERFTRPTIIELHLLLKQDLDGLGFEEQHFEALLKAMSKPDGVPPWTYSDVRTRLYPLAVSKAYPKAVTIEHFIAAAHETTPSPILEDI